MPWGRSGTDFPAPRLLALVDVLFQPSLDGLTTVPHVTAHSVAGRTVALVAPAVQGVNRNAQHFRDVRGDISLSPAWSVMIIFLSWMAVREHSGPPSDGGDLGAVSGPLDRLRTGDRQRPKSRSDSGRS